MEDPDRWGTRGCTERQEPEGAPEQTSHRLDRVGALELEPGYRLRTQLQVLLRARYCQTFLSTKVRTFAHPGCAFWSVQYTGAKAGGDRYWLQEYFHRLDGGSVRQLGAGRVDRGGTGRHAQEPAVELPDAHQIPAAPGGVRVSGERLGRHHR